MPTDTSIRLCWNMYTYSAKLYKQPSKKPCIIENRSNDYAMQFCAILATNYYLN